MESWSNRQLAEFLARMMRIQRLLVDRAPLHEVLEEVVVAARNLLGDDVAALRMADRDDNRRTTLVATAGASEELLSAHRRARAADGLGGRALRRRELVFVRGAEAREAVADLAAEDLTAALLCPVYEHGSAVGSLAVGSRSGGREYDSREELVLLSLADQAGLALNDAKASEDLAYEAFHDPVTGLANRALFLDRVDHARARAERAGGQLAVLFVDIDGFKTVNDSLGHGAGDSLLGAVGDRLAGRLRPADTIARLGGDEFGVLIEELESAEEAGRAARRVLAAFEDPFELHGREVFVAASVGVVAGRDDAGTMLRDADVAMSGAKAQGGGYEVFKPEMRAAAVDRMELGLDLQRALERDELVLHYQPIVNMRSREIVGLEALVRWRHPSRGLVLPDEFVPLAEQSGQIGRLGEWVLGEACRHAAEWRSSPGREELEITVNLSAGQLTARDLAGEVSDALAGASLDPEALVLEITETDLTADAAASIAALNAIRGTGVRLAMDDFGTGYSSLEYLSRFPLDFLKIAQVFVTDLEPGKDPPIVRAMIDLAEIFELRVIAEGVECERQVEALLALGCELGQGHQFSPALEAREVGAMLAAGSTLSP